MSIVPARLLRRSTASSARNTSIACSIASVFERPGRRSRRVLIRSSSMSKVVRMASVWHTASVPSTQSASAVRRECRIAHQRERGCHVRVRQSGPARLRLHRRPSLSNMPGTAVPTTVAGPPLELRRRVSGLPGLASPTSGRPGVRVTAASGRLGSGVGRGVVSERLASLPGFGSLVRRSRAARARGSSVHRARRTRQRARSRLACAARVQAHARCEQSVEWVPSLPSLSGQRTQHHDPFSEVIRSPAPHRRPRGTPGRHRHTRHRDPIIKAHTACGRSAARSRPS